MLMTMAVIAAVCESWLVEPPPGACMKPLPPNPFEVTVTVAVLDGALEDIVTHAEIDVSPPLPPDAVTPVPETETDGLLPKPVPEIVKDVIPPAVQESGLMDVISGVGSYTVNATELLGPNTVVTERLCAPVVALDEIE